MHWYVYAEMVYVCYQLTWAVYFWRLGRHGPAGEHAFLGFAVGGLCCFYGDDASTWSLCPPPRLSHYAASPSFAHVHAYALTRQGHSSGLDCAGRLATAPARHTSCRRRW